MVASSSNWIGTPSPWPSSRPNGTPLHPTLFYGPIERIMNREINHRTILWVDAVGGFLLCEQDHVTIGQAVPAAGVDIAIQADISRRHAMIRREADDYLLVPIGKTSAHGQPLSGATALSGRSILGLGAHVTMEFDRPHPLSATARLNVTSHHRTQPAVDGIVLMADAVVMGPSSQSHIVAPDWSQEVVLFRRDDQWRCRSKGAFEVAGREVSEEAVVPPGARVCGDDFSFCLEQIEGHRLQ